MLGLLKYAGGTEHGVLVLTERGGQSSGGDSPPSRACPERLLACFSNSWYLVLEVVVGMVVAVGMVAALHYGGTCVGSLVFNLSIIHHVFAVRVIAGGCPLWVGGDGGESRGTYGYVYSLSLAVNRLQIPADTYSPNMTFPAKVII